ncbi:MAG: tRNA (adenosine(37)-N6)-threonylcarbamoyltransferase complex dimerization subunit type 1 TsaB [Alphaproteobacteria bacterium]|nr:tRNA (adenosine(37)-N6)-threonylcarbamoyltransferase complex dimerization subunit type 1 TsaB [Alphaproteobacteria bacterium]
MKGRVVLAIDTSFGVVSAALATANGDAIAAFEADNPPGTQAETLPPAVAEMFSKADVQYEQLSRVAVTVGPGAFTGVRVGLAFAKGLRIATGAIVLGFTTLECLAAQVGRDNPGAAVAVAVDAKRGEVYLQLFSASLEPITAAGLMSIKSAARVVREHLKAPAVFTGSGAGLVRSAFDGSAKVELIARIDTKLLARRAAVADPNMYPPDAAYLRAPDARLPT